MEKIKTKNKKSVGPDMNVMKMYSLNRITNELKATFRGEKNQLEEKKEKIKVKKRRNQA